jgi:hypothetical protein
MKIPHTKSGYILVMALMIISLIVLITSIMNDTGGSYVPYMAAMEQRQKARLLARGGIAFAQSQLGRIVTAEQDKKGTQKKPTNPTDEQLAVTLLKDILPVLNHWQHIDFTFEKDGIDGSIEFLIACEQGKLNINELFDFKEKKFKDDKKGDQSVKTILTTLLTPVEKRMKISELVTALETMLGKRGYPLNDITELLTQKNFAGFKYAQFLSHTTHQASDAEKTPPFILTDLFTTHTNTMLLEPWLFSDSVRRLYGMQPLNSKAAIKKDTQDALAETLKKFKIKSDWNKDWDERLKPLYGVQLSQLSKGSVQFFTKTFEPCIFSVIVSATVGENTQRLYAILERIKKSQDTKTLYDIHIRTFYWI